MVEHDPRQQDLFLKSEVETQEKDEKLEKNIIDISEHELFSAFDKEKISHLLPQIADVHTRELALQELVSLNPFKYSAVKINIIKNLITKHGWSYDQFTQKWEEDWAPQVQETLRHWAESIEDKHVESQISWRDKAKATLNTRVDSMITSALPVIVGTAAVGAVARFFSGGTGIGVGAATGAAAGLFRRLNRKRDAVKNAFQDTRSSYVANLDELRSQIRDSNDTKQKVFQELGSQSPVAIVGIISEIIRQGSAREIGVKGDANEALLKQQILQTKLEREGSKEKQLEHKADAIISGLYNEAGEDQQRLVHIVNGNPKLMDAIQTFTNFRNGDFGHDQKQFGDNYNYQENKSDKTNNPYHQIDKQNQQLESVRSEVFGSATAMVAGGAIGGAIMYDSAIRMIPGALAGAYMGMKVGHKKDLEAQTEAFLTVAKDSIHKAEQVLTQYEYSQLDNNALNAISGIESDLRLAIQMGILKSDPALFYRARNVLRRLDSRKVEIKSKNQKADEILRLLKNDNAELIDKRQAFIDSFEKRPKWRTIVGGIAGALCGAAAVQALGSAAKLAKEYFDPDSINLPEQHIHVDSSDHITSDIPEMPEASGVEIDSLPQPENLEIPDAPDFFDELHITNPDTLQELRNLQQQFPSLDNQELKDYLDLAELQKDQGPEHRLIKQMNFLAEHLDGADKDKFYEMVDYKQGGRIELSTAINRSAHRLSISQRYMTGDNKYLAYPKWKDGVKQYYVLGTNQEGKFHFTHEQPTGKDLEVHLDEAKESNIARRARLAAQDNAEINSLRERILPNGELSEVSQDAQPRVYGEAPEEISEVLKERVGGEENVTGQETDVSALRERVSDNTQKLTLQDLLSERVAPDVANDNTPILEMPDEVPLSSHSDIQDIDHQTQVAEGYVDVQEYTGYKGPDTVDQLVETDRYVKEYGNLDFYTSSETAQYNRLRDALGWQHELFGKNGVHLKRMATEMGVDVKNPKIASKLQSIMRHHYDAVSDFQSGTRQNLSLRAIESKVRANMFGGNRDIPEMKHIKGNNVFDRDTFKQFQQKSLREYLQQDIKAQKEHDIELKEQREDERDWEELRNMGKTKKAA